MTSLDLEARQDDHFNISGERSTGYFLLRDCTLADQGFNSERSAYFNGGNSIAEGSVEQPPIEVDKLIVAELTRRVILGAMKLASTKTATRRRLLATFVDIRLPVNVQSLGRSSFRSTTPSRKAYKVA